MAESKYTIEPPPAAAAAPEAAPEGGKGIEYSIEPPATPAASAAPPAPAAPSSLATGQLETAVRAAAPMIKPMTEFAGGVVAPLVNFLDYPFRAGAADIYGMTHGAVPTDEASRDKFYGQREKALEATTVPESEMGQGVSYALGLPGQAIGAGVKAASDFALGPENTERLGPAATIAGDIAPIGLGLRSAMRSGGTPENIANLKAENRGRTLLSDKFNEGQTAGGPSAMDVIEEMRKARHEDQPMALLDAPNQEIRDATGTIYRQGGAGQGRIKQFLEQRRAQAGPRVRELLDKYVATGSGKETAEALLDQRSEHARPLFAAANQGPGLKAFEHQFTQAFDTASKDEFAAAQEVARAETAANATAARASQAGNVYSSSAAQEAQRTSARQLETARQALAEASQRKAEIRDMLQRAQQDGTLRPDAVWSPYLEMLRRENPHIIAGLKRGFEIERNKAHGRGERVNPRDYAIVGEDAHGNPIVGAVPNMRLWQAVKEGLDAEIEESINQETGKPSKYGESLMELRNGFLPELDRLNPAYKTAREVWSGDSQSFMAIGKGKHLLDKKWFPTTEHVIEEIEKMPPGDREMAKLGLAEDLRLKLSEKPDAADKSKLINNEFTRDRVRALLGPDAERFLEAMERERTMEGSRFETTGGAQTQGRAAADERNRLAMESGGGFLHHLSRGHIPGAAYHLMRALRAARSRPDLAGNEAAARMLADPGLYADMSGAPGTPLLPQVPVPRAAGRPGVSFPGGVFIQPHEDDPLARAMGR